MKRRTFLKSASLLPMMAYFPTFAQANQDDQPVLILIQLGGGNDSLNTFVPYSDDAYYDARGSLAIDRDKVLPLTSQLGLNPAMSALMESWQSADLAIVQGLGYANPNRSHFRGIDIWQTASDAETILQTGWLTGVMPEHNSTLQGVVLGGSPGALSGEPNQLSIKSLSSLEAVYLPSGSAATESISYIMSQRAAYNSAVDEINQADVYSLELSTEFQSDQFSSQCKLVAQLLAAGIRPHVIHLSLGSFDTHSNQRNAQDLLLSQLANGLASLRTELISQGVWSKVTVATYAEFGRRVAVNGSKGTDHGTAASHLVMGGSVNGGIYGTMPSLTDLDAGDLKYTEDFRAYYRTLNDWMLWTPSEELMPFSNMGFV